MKIHNVEVASIFNKVADLLEIENANPFRIRAYRTAARVIENLPQNVSDLIKSNYDLSELPGIGADLAQKIKIIVKTGELPILKKIESRLPSVLGDLLKIEGLGPKRVRTLYQMLKIRNFDDLKKAIDHEKIAELPKFGKKTQEKIRMGLEHLKVTAERTKLQDAFSIVDSLIHYLKKSKYVIKVECAGSFRRHKETIGDLDIIVSSNKGKKVIEHFIHFDEVAAVIAKGQTKSTIRLHSGIQVDLRVVPEKSYGAALLYFTGSKAHNIAIRKIALQKKLKINEYGVFKNNRQIAGKNEHEIYDQIGLSYIEPELREDRGEIARAKIHDLPQLITLNDIRGDLHCHTKATDGADTIAVMAKAAAELGYEYIAITDHSKHLAMVHGLNVKRLLTQIKLIDKLNEKSKNIIILKSIELDILEDGTLDLPNSILKELDLTICAIHSKFNLSSAKQTERIIRAMDNPYFSILAHPTGRLINQRKPFEVNLERIMTAAFERHRILELNAQPERMDLDDILCKMAKEFKVKLAISTDAHQKSQFKNMALGVFQARRGWLTADDVVNTYRLSKLKQILKKS